MDCRGLGRERDGGLILFWKENIQLKILSYSENHIGGTVMDEVDNHDWYFNSIYGHSEELIKRNTWKLIQDLVSRGGDRVLCCGDLNDIIFEQEKVGGNSRSSSPFSLGRRI